MLTGIHVRNFAIIDEVEIDFSGGMTVLTGETGAGKSILVDAMGLVLGDRGGTGLVRSGAGRAEFTAEFDLSGLPAARDWLEEQTLDMDHECILRRVISEDGRSRAFINGNNVPLQSLKTLGDMLLDIHGQHFHQSLARRDVQREMLDYFGGLSDLVAATADAYAGWKQQADKLEALDASDADRDARLDLLTFQIGELDALDLQADEYPALSAEQARLRNSGRLAEGVTAALQRIYDADDGNAHSLVAESARSIEALERYDETLRPAADLLSEANIQLAEAADLLRRYGESLDADPARQNHVEARLDAITNLARKHRVEPESLGELHRSLAAQREELEHAEERGDALREAVAAAEAAYRQTAEKLSAARRKAAKRFASEVTDAMGGLGMPGGVFDVRITPRGSGRPGAAGMDDIEFLVSANPGQDPEPLSKVASGGELSRMSLAIQVIASDGSRVPTMVFDEVDSGVGGGVAEMVGLRLRELGKTRQVFCVTHLPQVASLGNHHFRIMKISDGKSTRTAITALNEDERVKEIARMLGGVEITRRTMDHAAEMLASGTSMPVSGKRA
jgi:DNA repair protein RecN (Recombination protein N)